jgi:hypothetical protein
MIIVLVQIAIVDVVSIRKIDRKNGMRIVLDLIIRRDEMILFITCFLYICSVGIQMITTRNSEISCSSCQCLGYVFEPLKMAYSAI